MPKGKQKKDQPSVPQAKSRAQGAQASSAAPAFNGELPHSTKKVSLGPNTKR